MKLVNKLPELSSNNYVNEITNKQLNNLHQLAENEIMKALFEGKEYCDIKEFGRISRYIFPKWLIKTFKYIKKRLDYK
jgi:hypothetical protein